MYGVVPATGEDRGLGALTDDRPTGLVEIAGQPLLAHVFATLIDSGVDELVVIVGDETADIIESFGDGYEDVPITYVHHGEQRGMGDAVLQARAVVDGPFIVVAGNTVFRHDLSWAIEAFDAESAEGVVVVEPADRDSDQAAGVVTAADGRVTELSDWPAVPPATLATTGCFVCPTAMFDALALCRSLGYDEYEIVDGLDVLLAAGATIWAVPLVGSRVTVTRPADIERAARLCKRDGEC